MKARQKLMLFYLYLGVLCAIALAGIPSHWEMAQRANAAQQTNTTTQAKADALFTYVSQDETEVVTMEVLKGNNGHEVLVVKDVAGEHILQIVPLPTIDGLNRVKLIAGGRAVLYTHDHAKSQVVLTRTRRSGGDWKWRYAYATKSPIRLTTGRVYELPDLFAPKKLNVAFSSIVP